MYVELPNSGCNVLIASDSFYNYSPDGHTRERYYIFDGKAHLQSSDYFQYGYSYTGTCLSTGDLVYKPELKIYFEFISFILYGVIILLIYQLIIRRLRWRS